MLYHGTSAILDLYDRARGRCHVNQYCTSARDITNLSRMKPYFRYCVYVRMRKHHVFPCVQLSLEAVSRWLVENPSPSLNVQVIECTNCEWRKRTSKQEKKTLALVERSAPIFYCF